MSDPFALLPLALAAGGGRLDAFEAQELVAAGLTLLQRSPTLVRALHRRRAAVLLPTGPAFLTALAAAEGRGAVLINPLAAPAEIEYQIANAQVGAVLTNRALAPRVPEHVVRVLLDDAPRAARVLSGGASSDVDLGTHFGLPLVGEIDAPGRDEEAVVVYTSAMAGVPLGAVLTHRNVIANARSTVTAAELSADDHALAMLPYSHLFGLVVSGAAPLFAGGRVTCMDRFNPIRAIDILESSDVTLLVGVPAVFGALATALMRRGRPLRSDALRVCICGGAPLSTELQAQWAELTGVELRQGYGLTEAGPVCLFNRVDQPNRRGTIGVPFPGVDVEIREPASGALLGAGEIGEIWVAGDNVSPGYLPAAATSDSPWTAGLPRRDGWLCTGDLGSGDADGAITFRGVRKPMFTRSGFNIYPAELERAVRELPGVREARVRPIPDPARENDIALEVTGTVTDRDVKGWCERRLSGYKQPAVVEVRAG